MREGDRKVDRVVPDDENTLGELPGSLAQWMSVPVAIDGAMLQAKRETQAWFQHVGQFDITNVLSLHMVLFINTIPCHKV